MDLLVLVRAASSATPAALLLRPPGQTHAISLCVLHTTACFMRASGTAHSATHEMPART